MHWCLNCALITKLPIRSHNHSGCRAVLFFMTSEAVIGLIIFLLRGVSEVTGPQQCQNNSKCYCMWSVSTESGWMSMEGLTFTAKGCSALFFPPTTIQNLFLFLYVLTHPTSSQGGCIKCLTEGHLLCPQFRLSLSTWANKLLNCPLESMSVCPTFQHDSCSPTTGAAQITCSSVSVLSCLTWQEWVMANMKFLKL